MGVSVTPNFSREDFQNMMAEEIRRVGDVILFNFKRIGEMFVTNNRNNDTYKDRTGNLRSSIGYVILKDGEQIFEDFKTFSGTEKVADVQRIIKKKVQEDPGFTSFINKTAKGGLQVDKSAPVIVLNGQDQARAVIEELKKKYPRGYVLIGVAGMNYAAAVEAKGYDVITSGAIIAANDLRKAVKRISAKIAA